MLKELQKYIKNQQKIPENEHLQILGSQPELEQAAMLWERNGDLFEMIAAIKLLNWVQNSEYDHNQLAAYKTGLAEIPVFLAECSAIMQEKDKQEEQS